MAKGHLLITPPPTRSKTDREELVESTTVTRSSSSGSCFKQITISDVIILLSGIQLAVMAGYLLHLTIHYDAPVYPLIKYKVNIGLIVVPVMIAVVMLLVFGIVRRRLWMLIPNVLAQLALVAVFIWATVFVGQAVANFQLPPDTDPRYKFAQDKLYQLKVYMAWSIVAMIVCLLTAVVMILCFLRVYKTRGTEKVETHENGY